MQRFETVTVLRIGLASPEQMRRWSYGEVTRPETINYRTHKPEKEGLFSEQIFGPLRDWSCACGKYKYVHEAGVICEKCGVALAPATVRRERMGHIELAASIVHPWYLRDRSISQLLNLSPWQLSAVQASERYLVLAIDEVERRNIHAQMHHEDDTEAQIADVLMALRVGDLLDGTQYYTLLSRFHAVVDAKTGAEAIQERLSALDLEQLAASLRDELAAQDTDRKQVLRRLRVVEAFRASGQDPAWMVLSVLPVLPPELRPVLQLENGRWASSDLNELYCRVLHCNNRLKNFMQQQAPEILLNHERRLLQDACSALLDNAHQKKPTRGARKQPLKSLTDALQGKQGRFRRNLLGKRVDYSGRSVIVAGPNLLLHECGLPKAMACELFKPFVMRKLLDRHYARSPKVAKRMVERRDPCIWDLLEEVMFERVVLLNRAPTLHRLSIQAFQPRLIEGNALQLHPLVCSAFNADFDGDQMAVHVPLSQVAQEEAHRLLLATHHLRHPASGEPAIIPSQEIVLGCFYLTEERPGEKPAHSVFTDRNEVLLAYAAGHIKVHTPLCVRLPGQQVYMTQPPAELQIPSRGRVQTTVGRLLFNEILPEALHYRNYPMTKDALKALIAECLVTCGEETTVRLLDAMKRLGYQYATKSGISFALSDIVMPPERDTLIQQSQAQGEEIETLYHAGEMTYEEWYRQVIALWTETTDAISGKLQEALDPYGTIMTIVKSGATKAKFQQIRQLSGIRGLLASPSGAILPIPVLSNYLLGLHVWEIFIAASGARKGFMDRSLNMAMSGYLTRRLVEAGMEAVITQEDCHTTEGQLITSAACHRLGLPTMRSLVIGRVLAEAVGTFPAGTLLDETLVDGLLASGVESLRVRSPLSCQTPYGLCAQCYGADLATGKLVTRGAAVGVIAGQAIGEPGTQLTMRTFHAGGIANNAADITLGLPRVNELFEAHIPAHPAPFADRRGIVNAIEKDEAMGEVHVHCVSDTAQEHEEWTYMLPLGRSLMVQSGQVVEIGMSLIAGPLDPQELLQRLGQEAVQHYIINEVQRVYRATGAVIHNKHLEVIVRQMLRYVVVADPGDMDLFPGESLDRFVFLHRVAAIVAQGGKPALARPQLLGLTKTVLHTSSWVAAASFQDMSRILAGAAIERRRDGLVGLKEKLVVGASFLR
jgi:DNA-directed RNA polymerase subunit beta'